LAEELRQRYTIDSPIGVGGVGVVLKAIDLNLGVPRALKFPRPQQGNEILFADIVVSEISRLREAVHPNIIEIYFQGRLQVDDSHVPYYLMEYVPDSTDALEYFHASPRSVADIIRVLGQLISGLEHLHSIDMIHNDVKLENVLVSQDGRAVISDLGSARKLSDGPERTLIAFTRPFAHPELISLVGTTTYSDPNRVKAEIGRSKLNKLFDLYALGKNILRLLAIW
jgi:serine/threonine-protein kinase